jgi:hypothetical protein
MRGDRNSRNKIVTTNPNLSILHQNIQSTGNKLIEGKVSMELQLDATITVLLISKISSTN